MRRAKTTKIEGVQNLIQQTYKKVSIFSWYMPQNLNNRGKEYRMRRSKEDSTGSEKVPYYPDEKFHIVKHKKMQGNNYSLQNPYQGFVPYCADDQILKSCDIKFPFKINLT